MSSLKVGDLCVLVNANPMPELNGMECTITGGLMYRADIFNPVTAERLAGVGYQIQLRGHSGFLYAEPHELRRIDPPNNQFLPCESEWLDDFKCMFAKERV